MADIRRLEDETQQELNRRMAQFQNENIRLSLSNPSSNDTKNASSLTCPTNEIANDINQPLANKRSRQMSIDNINASRPRINSFPVPPLPRDETADDEFFDAECKFNFHERSFVFIPAIILAQMDGLSLSRLSHSLFNSLEDIQLTDSINSGSHQSSLDDDERASGLPIIDDSGNKCSIEILMLVFYGGKC